MKKKALSRDDRKCQILLVFAVDVQTGGEGHMTLADIARDMHLAPSTKLRDMVKELEIEGLLTDQTEPIPGVCKFRRIYMPTANLDSRTGKPKHEPRTIKINARRNGQQTLWEEIVS